MWNGQDTLFGPEWIDYSKTYFKIKVAEDGIYRIDFQTLESAGFPAGIVPASDWRLYRNGQQEAIFSSTNGVFGAADFIEFYGQKNRGEVDRYLFEDAETEQINPWYSMFNDTSVYYLVWGTGGPAQRFTAAVNDLSNLPPAEPFCWQTAEKVMTDAIYKKKISEEIQYSWYDGNGYTRPNSGAANPVLVSLPKIFSNGPDAQVQVRYAANLGQHQQRILLNDSIFAEDEFTDFRIIDRKFNVGASFLTATTTFKLFSPIGDRNGLARIGIRYPRKFEFENAYFAAFELEASAADKYLEIQSFNLSSGAGVLWDLSQKTRLVTMLESGLLKAKIGPAASIRSMLLLSPAAVKTVSELQPVQFKNLASEAADYLIISNPALYQDAPAGGADPVAAYADYRRSPAGGNHTVSVFDVNDLY